MMRSHHISSKSRFQELISCYNDFAATINVAIVLNAAKTLNLTPLERTTYNHAQFAEWNT